MAEGGENPKKADYTDDDSETRDEEDCETQHQQSVEAIQCTDHDKTETLTSGDQEENHVDESVRAFQAGGTVPFAAAEGKDPIKERTAKKKILTENMQHLWKMMHEQNAVTAEMRQLMRLIKKQSLEIDQLDKNIMAKVVILCKAMSE